MGRITPKVTRGSEVHVRKLGPNRVEVIDTPVAGVEEKPFQCDNRIGSYEAVAKLFSHRLAHIEHPECIHRGGSKCRYLVSWQSPAHIWWRFARNSMAIFAFFLFGGVYAGGYQHIALWGAGAAVLLISLLTGLAYAKEKKSLNATIEQQGNAARRLLREIDVRYNTAALIQDISNMASWSLDVDQIILFVVQALKTRLGMDRVILLYEGTEQMEQLHLAHDGYDSAIVDFFKHAWARHDQDIDGAMAAILHARQALLLNTIEERDGILDPAQQGFLSHIGAQAFVGVPMVYEGKLVGFLAADYVQTRRYLSKSDAHLFSGLSAQTAVNIFNATSYNKLKASERQYRLLADNVSDVIWLLDIADLRFSYVSPSQFRLTGHSAEEVMTLSLENLMTLDSLEKAYAAIGEELDREQDQDADPDRSRTIELEQYCKDGHQIWTEITARLIRDANGVPIRILGVTRDISERVQALQKQEQLRQQLERARKMEAIGTLAGGVAHDLNNILSGLVSYPELLLLRLPSDSPLAGPMKTILKSGERAAAIVQDLLTLARRGVTITEILDLNVIIDDYLHSPEHERLLSFHPECQLVKDLGSEIHLVKGSSFHLLKTVMNLVSNAAEAIPEKGRIEIGTANRTVASSCRGYETVPEGEYVVLSVKDTGTGIDVKDLGHIFEPFYTKKVMGRSGTGLGMAVVWGTVKDHCGYIDVQTTKGQGTTVTIYFPATDAQTGEQYTPYPVGDYSGREETILIVDDISEQREVASEILCELGYRVDSVNSGEKAVEYLRNHSVDLVILDMIMDPGVDGLETYRRILQVRPGQKAIIATGFSKSERVMETLSLGAGGCIKKPYSIEAIASAVRKELDRH